jgi:hypothetical protein
MNISNLIDEYGIPTAPEGHHHTRPGWRQLDCPDCSPNSSRWLLGISEMTLRSNCYQCGPRSTFKVLKHYIPHLTWETVRNADTYQRPHEPDHRGIFRPPLGIGPLLQAHRSYLKSRGFNSSKIERLWQIRGIGIAGHLAWRLWIPVLVHGTAVSWLTRAIGEGRQRYLNAKPEEESIPRSKTLYGADYAFHRVVVVEGPLDAWKIGPGCVSTCGLAYTQSQVQKLSRYSVRAICFDNEPEAQKRARQLADDLSPFPGSTHVITLDSKDAGSATRREITKVRKHFLD